MANSKISALTSATTPLAGTETLPVVQSSATTKVAVSDLTAGRSVSGANFVVTSSTIPANGVYLPAANSVGIASNTTLRVTVDASGNVGIGTSTINAKVQIQVGDNAPAASGSMNTGVVIQANTGQRAVNIGANNTGGYSWINAAFANNSGVADNLVLMTGTTERLRIGSTGNITFTTGNVVQGTAAKGVDFSANTPLAGKTSTILNWYEEGTWTPNQGAGLTLVGAFSSTGKYTRVGRNVTVSGTVTGATSVAVTAGGVITTNLPFTIGTAGHGNATNAAITASAAVICNTGTTLTSAGAIAATGTITFSATYFV
jgi:hypothetical protein